MSRAIVTGTVIETYPRLNEHGDIETVTRILVDETIKGDVPVDRIFDLVQFGGHLNDRYQEQSGAPKYVAGERYLVVLERDGRGNWTTFDLSLGQFHFVDHDGMQLLHRNTSDITGWTEKGEAFEGDADRPASLVLAFARDIAKSSPVSSITTPKPATEAALDYDLKAVTITAVGKWNGAPKTAGLMNDSVSNSPASGNTKDLSDGETRMIADDPNGDIAGTFNGSGVVATAFFGGSGSGSFNSETYFTLSVEDVVVQDGVSSATLSSSNFTSAIVHEVGHTWGFRHSNQNASGGSCAAPLPCTSTAIMNSSIVNGLNGTLQSYDMDAANEVYGDGTRQASFTGSQYVVQLGGLPARRPANTSWRISQASQSCTAPGITTQPSSTSITFGGSTTLSVVASGSTPTYQWYIGNPPSTTTPAPSGTNASIQVSPSSTTTYWVRVTNSCGTADSNAATVTVGACASPAITTQPVNKTITSGSSTTLSVGASGSATLSYQWYAGNPPSTTTPAGTGSAIQVSPTSTTNYWVRVTNSCGTADSNAATVTVNACTAPVVSVQPQDQSVVTGNTVTLSFDINIATLPLTFTWFRGTAGDESNPVGNGKAIISPVITSTTTFFAKAQNPCGFAYSRTVTITATTICTAPAITAAGANPASLTPGDSTTLTVTATGTSLTYQWFKGSSGDTSKPIANATNAALVDSPTTTTSYWVRVSSGCGAAAVDSQTITVTVASNCVAPILAPLPAEVSIYSGSTTTFTATTTAGTAPLHYAWFQGAKFDTSKPVGTDSPTYTTANLTSNTNYFVNVSNSCGNFNSETITVKVLMPRRRASRR